LNNTIMPCKSVGVLCCVVRAWQISVLVFKTLSLGVYLLNSYLLLEERICLCFRDQAAKKTDCIPFDMALHPGKLEPLNLLFYSLPCPDCDGNHWTCPSFSMGHFLPAFSSNKVVGIWC